MKQLTLLVLTQLSVFSVSAEDIFCQWEGRNIPVGDTIWVEDKILMAAEASRDWAGFLLKCVHSLKPISIDNQQIIGEQIEIGAPVIVFGEIHVNFYDHVKGLTLNQILENRNSNNH